jgi:hypothetical protein
MNVNNINVYGVAEFALLVYRPMYKFNEVFSSNEDRNGKDRRATEMQENL